MQYVEDLLLDILKGIVEKPDEVELHISDEKDDRGDVTIINVKLAREDVGACIGQKGKNAEAIRKVIGLVGFKQTGKRVYVKIDAPRIPKNHFEYETADTSEKK